MPTPDTLIYLAAVLKFTAVPAATFEFVTQERRKMIERWLVHHLPGLIKSFSLTLLALYTCVFLLVRFAPYLALFFYPLCHLIIRAILFRSNEADWVGQTVLSLALSLGVAVAAIFERWLLPESWVLAIAYPVEAVAVWANGIPYVDWVIPDYSGTGFLTDFRHLFIGLEDWLWDWLAFANWGYFFLTRGIMLLMVVLIQILFFIGVLLGLLLTLGSPVCVFIKCLDSIKRVLQLEADRIPVGAYMLWATGEILEFGLKTLEQFQKITS